MSLCKILIYNIHMKVALNVVFLGFSVLYIYFQTFIKKISWTLILFHWFCLDHFFLVLLLRNLILTFFTSFFSPVLVFPLYFLVSASSNPFFPCLSDFQLFHLFFVLFIFPIKLFDMTAYGISLSGNINISY